MPGPFALLASAWRTYRSHLFTVLKLVLFPMILTLLLVTLLAVILVATGTLSNFNLGTLQLAVLIPTLLVAIIFAMIFSLLGRTSLLAFLDHQDTYPGLLPLYRQIWPILGKFLLTQALVGIFILGGLILLIIPGLVLAVRYLFVPFIVVAEGKFGKAALAQSSAYVKGKFWGIVGRSVFISFISLLISGAATQVDNTIIASALQIVMALGVAPLTTIYFYHLYQECKLGGSDSPSFAFSRPAPAPIA